MITIDGVTETLTRLSRFFIRCYQSGQQSRDLDPQDAAAFGQYLDQLPSHHRGMHGTSAALRVLASVDGSEGRTAARRVVRYLTDRAAIEEVAPPPQGKEDRIRKVREDEQNVIKVSEVLYALSHVPRSVAETGSLVSDLAARLRAGMTQNRAWTYFLNESQAPPQLLPTAYAVRGLAAHRYDVGEPVQYLVRELQSPMGRPRQTDISVRVLCVFVLAFLPSLPAGVEEGKLRGWLARLWNQLEPLLGQDLEANIEYSNGDSNYYVRVPWQLYLISAASRLKPFRCFASALAQRRLSSIVKAVGSEEGFFYPHSGDRVSSRTNGILYDVLWLIRDEIRSKAIFLIPFQIIDNVRVFFGSRRMKVSLTVLVLAIIVASIWSWTRAASASIADLGPGFAGALMLLILSARKEAP